MLMSTTPLLTADERDAILEAVRDFSDTELAPFAIERDEHKIFPRDALRKAGELGLGGISLREDVGGSGLGRSEAVQIFEALAHGDTAVAAYISIHNMAAWMIDTYGTEAQRTAWLPRLVTMGDLASYCLTEPGAGSDAAALQTRAVRDGDDYVLTGVKQFISGAGEASVYVVMARTGDAGARGISAFLVDAALPGLSFGQLERKMGWNAQPTRQVILDGVRVPASALLGAEGQGFKIAMSGLDGGRLNIAACSIGGAQWALDRTVRYVHERFGVGRAARRERGRRVRDRRHGDRPGGIPRARARRRRGARREGSGCHDAVRHGQAIRDGCRIPRRERSPATARRLRLPAGLRYREGGARPARAPDPRGHQRDHAHDRRPRGAARVRACLGPR